MELEKWQKLIEAHPYASTAILIWVMVWKGVALWRAAERGEKAWFTIILVVNTLGLLEIIYLFFVVPRTAKDGGSNKPNNLV